MSVDNLTLLGGRLCLDFVNTLAPRRGPSPCERLGADVDVVDWARHTGVIDRATAETLRSEVPKGPPGELVRAAIALREACFAIFSGQEEAAPDALATLKHEYAAAVSASSLDQHAPSGWHLQTTPRIALDAVALDAVDLLHSGLAGRVKQCASTDTCGWLFLDATRNGTRRWCSMQYCGSRAKSRRAYARRSAGARG